MKIKEWPIVLTCSLQCSSTAGRLARLPFYSLDQLKTPEVVKMFDTQCDTIKSCNDERSRRYVEFQR